MNHENASMSLLITIYWVLSYVNILFIAEEQFKMVFI